ncbi:MAG TPA: SDR family NAD(P)-dependent oxidoreductase [Candidatus Wunengus sp. YC65]|uniref:SDR family NAD(P)-dependent oxidoreductase n=1 Tax=Candidatus Wunengus sp. YC65 TaxID=3367701 RepID=UPI00402631BF
MVVGEVENNKGTVLITGGTSGIGSTVAVKFAKEGWDVVCHYFTSEERAGSLKKVIENCGVKCYLIKSDFSKKVDIQKFIKELTNYNVVSLINNAGTYVVNKHFCELTIDEIIETFTVNTFAPMLLTANIFMKMKERRFGRIVNISSIAAKYGGSSYSLHYGCSKHAIEGLTKTLAREGTEYNILINTVRPGVIDTEFHKKFPKDMTKRVEIIPMKRMGTPEDVSDMVYYLGSDKNKFITNEIMTIAGGE